jgi:nitronate monooxygenase
MWTGARMLGTGEDAAMWPDRRLLDLFDVEHPLVLAPMAGLGTAALAAAVSSGGGLGSISCAALSPQLTATVIRDARALTDKPLNVNFFCHGRARVAADRERAWCERLQRYYDELQVDRELAPPGRMDLPPFDEAMCSVVEDARPKVVSFHFGLPEQVLVARIKAAGCIVISSATTVEEALWLQAHGADAIIAQGCEAGGHRAMFADRDIDGAIASQPGTFALVPQVVDAVSVPVIAAGGIADGRGIAAAFALGAAGVQIGTAYLRCPEAATPPLHREALRQARADSTVLTNVFTGKPARVIGNRLTREVGPIAAQLPDFPQPLGQVAPLRAAAEAQGSRDFTPLWAGQAAALGCELAARDLTDRLAKEALGRLRQLGGRFER